MKNLLLHLWKKFLGVFGDIKIFKWPFFVVYDPSFFKMTGDKVLKVLEIIKPGDIIIRGFDGYLDGKFVPSKCGYSHAGVYIGNNIIIHAVSPFVTQINVIDFCQCDRIAIVRPRSGVSEAIETAQNMFKNKIPYDYLFERGTSSVYCFELAKECYSQLNIKEIEKTSCFGLIKKNVILSDSFFESNDCETVFEYNPKYKIDFVK